MIIVSQLTLSNVCSILRLTKPPHKREDPKTRRRFERMEPKREYFNTSIFLWWRANSAIISSVALPHVAFSRPPTAWMHIFTSVKCKWSLRNLIRKHKLINLLFFSIDGLRDDIPVEPVKYAICLWINVFGLGQKERREEFRQLLVTARIDFIKSHGKSKLDLLS